MLQNERYHPGEMKESWGLFFSSLLCCQKLGRLIEMRGVWWTSRLINQPWNLILTLETLSTGLSYSALPVWQSDSQNCFVDAAELWRRKASLLITRPSWPLTVVHLPPKGSFHKSLGGGLTRACILIMFILFLFHNYHLLRAEQPCDAELIIQEGLKVS